MPEKPDKPNSRPRTGKKTATATAVASVLPTDPSQYDERVHWIRLKLESGLMVEFENAKTNQEDLLVNCLERNERRNLIDLYNFLDDNTAKSSLIFWTETQNIEIPLENNLADSEPQNQSLEEPVAEQPAASTESSLGVKGMFALTRRN